MNRSEQHAMRRRVRSPWAPLRRAALTPSIRRRSKPRDDLTDNEELRRIAITVRTAIPMGRKGGAKST
jgi:hypothetical protein